MDKRKFLIVSAFLGGVALCWTCGPAAAQENVTGKRDMSWSRMDQTVQGRAKANPAFQKYLDIYNAHNQALSQGPAGAGSQGSGAKHESSKKGEGK